MPNINDTYASVLSGYSGSVNDRRSELLTGILAYATPLSLNDMEAAALASLGYTGALNDAWDKYIKALGGFGISVKADYLSSTFYGNPVPFLFKASEPGAWYDPSDLTTMFQDNLGSTPVTTAGQTVGLLLDKSQNGVGTNGSSRRNLLVATATLSTQSVTVTAVAHTLSFTGVGTVTLTGASIAGPLVGTGASNRVSLTFTPTAGSLTLTVVGSVTLAQLEIGSTATAYQPITTSWSATLAGNHATQATSTQRPIYGINPVVGTRNVLTYSEQFENAAWTKTRATISADIVTAPDGTLTADKLVEDTTATNSHLCYRSFTTVNATTYTVSFYVKAAGRNQVSVQLSSGAAAFTANAIVVVDLSNGSIVSGSGTVTNVNDGWYRISVVNTAIAAQPADIIIRPAVAGNVNYTGDGASGIYLWGAQMELSTTATSYQKVVTQYEVTQAGVQSIGYLLFDGVDDGMVTGTITPGTDKVQVFAGLRKLSDVTLGIVAETSVNGTVGSFFLAAPRTAGQAVYGFVSTTTINTSATSSSIFAAPITSVVTGIGDISGDVATLRVDNVQRAAVTTDQGAGNYLAFPLYIGRRGGSTFPYNGRIYSLIVRFGANLTTGQITSTEKWVNSKTGAF